MSGSLDGFVKIWNWKNVTKEVENLQPKIILGFDDTKVKFLLNKFIFKSRESKCWTCNFSTEGTYAIAAFGKKIRKA